MSRKLWSKVSMLALFSAFLVGCNNGPEKDKRVIGAAKGNPPHNFAQSNPQAPTTAFPKVGGPANVGQGTPLLPNFGPIPGPTGAAPVTNQPTNPLLQPAAPGVQPAGTGVPTYTQPTNFAPTPQPINPQSNFGTIPLPQPIAR